MRVAWVLEDVQKKRLHWFRTNILDTIVPVQGIAALHMHNSDVLQAHDMQCLCIFNTNT